MMLAEKVGALRRTMHRALTRRLSRVSKRPFCHLLALRVISRGEVKTQSELAERLLIDGPSVSRLVARLVSDGLLERESCDDRRCVRLRVTRAAKPETDALQHALDWLDGEVKRHLDAHALALFSESLDVLQSELSSLPEKVLTKAAPPKVRGRSAQS